MRFLSRPPIADCMRRTARYNPASPKQFKNIFRPFNLPHRRPPTRSTDATVRTSYGKRRSASGKTKPLVWQRRNLPYKTWRSEEHTSELQSHVNLVCRLLL